MRILALVTDAFGGAGGIAKFNRDLLEALCAAPQVTEVVAVPRLIQNSIGRLPPGLQYRAEAARGKARFLLAALRALQQTRHDIVWIGHINLLPLAWIAHLRRARVVLNIHGVDAWTPHPSRLVRRALRHVDVIVSVSDVTRKRFVEWSGLADKRAFILPNCVNLAAFGPAPRDPTLVERYGLAGCTVIMTLARLSAVERYKGIDEVIESLPELSRQVPNLVYLVCGDGDDRARLISKAAALGLAVSDLSQHSGGNSDFYPRPATKNRDLETLPARVVFTGRVPESQKADHFRLADAFVMAGWGEGFGIVYLEALACGVPVVASKLDASREAVREGELGVLVDPKNPAELREGILTALKQARGVVPAKLMQFAFGNYQQRVNDLLHFISGGAESSEEALRHSAAPVCDERARLDTVAR